MSRDQEIEDIVTQLNNLNIRQASLLARLERATNTQTPPANTSNDFRIGDRVTILNPRRLQQTSGNITKIGATRVTVQTSNGSKISRAPKNLAHAPL